MGLAQWLASGVFIAGYAAIAFEHKLKIDKSAVALVVGVGLWLLAAATTTGLAGHLQQAGSEIFEIFAFLLAAMLLVEILAHCRLFDAIRIQLARRHLADRPQFAVLMTITFFMSSVLDNLTIAIVNRSAYGSSKAKTAWLP